MILSELKVEMLKCRTLGHAWDDFIPMMKPPEFGDRLSFRCVRCETERHDICSWVDGSLIQREYRYQEDYKLAEKYLRNDFRLALMNTLKPKRGRRQGRAAS